MLVCHIWQSFYPIESGGVERYILNLSDSLSYHKDMHFLMVTDRAAYVPFLRALRTSRSERIGSIGVYRLGPYSSSLVRGVSLKVLRRTSKIMENKLSRDLFEQAITIPQMNEVDVFHVHGIWKPLYPKLGMQLSKHFRRPFLVTLHGDSVNPDDPYAMPMKAPSTYQVLRLSNAITTYSKETLRVLNELGLAKKALLVPNFIDTKLFKPPTPISDRTGMRILMVSRLSQPKDPMTPIRAFARVLKAMPKATFTIIGYGPLYETANKLVQTLNLQGSVSMLGMKADVRKYFWNSDIAIGTRGSYLTTLESWAAGIPVIAPDFGIMKEIISNRENGLLVTPGNTQQLAEAIVDLIKNNAFRREIVLNGQKAVEKYDIKTVGSSIETIYRSLKDSS